MDALRHPAFRHVQSFLVAHEDELKVELYLRDRRAVDLSNVHSVTKSVLATLVGIAIERGSLSLGTPIGDVLETAALRSEPEKRALTVRHFLTMTTGLKADGGYDIDDIADRGESWVDGPLMAPLEASPGTSFTYNNGAAHVLGVVVARATGMPLARLAEQHLLGPLEIDEYRWPTDPEGHHLGYGHLELRPRDLLRLGELYLNEGRFRGEDILPASFAAAATTPQSEGGPPEGVPYGYLWWTAEELGHRSFFAGGYAGQFVTVVPGLALVVVSTGDAAVFIETSRDVRQLVAEVVVPTLAS